MMPQHGLASVGFSFTVLVVKSAQMDWPIRSARSTRRVFTEKRNVYPVAVSRAVTMDVIVSMRTIEQQEGCEGVPCILSDGSRDWAASGALRHAAATAIRIMKTRFRAPRSCGLCIGG